MHLRKKLNKLARMHPDEIRFRVSQQLRYRLEAWHCRAGDRGGEGMQFWPGWVRRLTRAQAAGFPDSSVGFFAFASDPDTLRQAFQRSFPEREAEVLSRAKQLMHHRFHFLGLDVQLPETVNWNRNPASGAEYPLVHHSRLPIYETARFGDVKYVWELNRHQFFVELARAYLLTGNEAYVERIWQWLDSWLAQNPYKRGVNWTSALEAAVRIFSWVWSYYFTRHSRHWTERRRHRLLQGLLLHGCYIEENLSYYFSPYNHLIGELAALAFLGTVFPALPQTRRWRDRYWQELEAQWPHQFHPDGMSVEQASYYHHFTWGFYFQLALLRQQNGLPVSRELWKGMETALRLMTWFTRPDGRVPMLGDIDNARSIYFYLPGDQWDLRSFQALGAVQFSRPEMKWVAGQAGEEVLWLYGPKGVLRFQQLPSRPPEKRTALFPHSGYLIWRSSWNQDGNYLLFDFGPVAAGLHGDDTPSAAHGHADILQVEVCVQGQPLLLDPGFFTYFGPLALHRYFRSTGGHNLVEVDGCGQAMHENRLGWSRVAEPRLLATSDQEPLRVACARINHFSGREHLFHQRTLIWKDQAYLLVADYLNTEASDSKRYHLQSYWHFAPRSLRMEGQAVWEGDRPVMLFAGNPPVRCRLVKGQNNPPLGWMATGYGSIQPTPVLVVEQETDLPVLNIYLVPLNEKIAGQVQLSFTTEADRSCVRVRQPDGEDSFYFPVNQCPGPLHLPIGDVKLALALLAGRLSVTGEPDRWFVLSPAKKDHPDGQFDWLSIPTHNTVTTE